MPVDFFGKSISVGSRLLFIDSRDHHHYLELGEVTKIDYDDEYIYVTFLNKSNGNESGGSGAFSFDKAGTSSVLVQSGNPVNSIDEKTRFREIAARICAYPDTLMKIRDLYKRSRKIEGIKAIRKASGCGLKDAKNFYEKDLDRWI